MAKNKKATRSLHIQNDQTDTAGVYQRNRGMDLFMAGPAGIREFTNWNDKATSLADPDLPAAAFSDSPYKPVVSSYSGDSEIPSGIEIDDDVAFVSYKKFSPEVYTYGAHLQKDVTLIHRIRMQYQYCYHDVCPTGVIYGPAFIEGVGTYADCEELLEKSHCNENVQWKFKLGHFTFASAVGDFVDDRPQVACLVDLSRCGTDRALLNAYGGVTNEIQDSDIAPTDIAKVMTKHIEFEGGQTAGGGFSGGGPFPELGLPSPYDLPELPVNTGINESFVYPTEDKVDGINLPGIAINGDKKYFYFPLEAGISDGSSPMDTADCNLAGIEILAQITVTNNHTRPTLNGQPLTVTYYLETFIVGGGLTTSAPVPDSEDGYYYKTGNVHEAGRVDSYRRKSGSIKSINAGTEEVILQDSFGTVQSYLEDGDKIKISSVLNDDSQDEIIHPLNGIKYVRKMSQATATDSSGDAYVYNAYHIYEDDQLTVRADVTGYRDITSSVWTYYGSTLSTSGTWEYTETLFSQDADNYYLNGVSLGGGTGQSNSRTPWDSASKAIQINGILKPSTVFSDFASYASTQQAPYIFGGESVRSKEEYASNIRVKDLPFLDPDGFRSMPESFWFGHAMAIKNKKVAISEIGNNYSYFSGRDAYGNTGGTIYIDMDYIPDWIEKFRDGMQLQPTVNTDTQTQSGLVDDTTFVANLDTAANDGFSVLAQLYTTITLEDYKEKVTNQRADSWLPSDPGNPGGLSKTLPDGTFLSYYRSLKNPFPYQLHDGRGRIGLFTIKGAAKEGFDYSTPTDTNKQVLTFDATIDASSTNPYISSGHWTKSKASLNSLWRQDLNTLIRDVRDVYWINCVEKTDPNDRTTDGLWWEPRPRWPGQHVSRGILTRFHREMDSDFYKEQILKYERDNLIGNYSGRTSGFLYSDNFGYQLCFGNDGLLYVSNRTSHYAAPESIAVDVLLNSDGLVVDGAFENSSDWNKYKTTPRPVDPTFLGINCNGNDDTTYFDKGFEDLVDRYTKTNRFMLQQNNDNSSSIHVVPTDKLALKLSGPAGFYNVGSAHLSMQSMKYDYMPEREVPYDMSFRNGRLIVGIGKSPHEETYDGIMCKVFDRGSASYAHYSTVLADQYGASTVGKAVSIPRGVELKYNPQLTDAPYGSEDVTRLWPPRYRGGTGFTLHGVTGTSRPVIYKFLLSDWKENPTADTSAMRPFYSALNQSSAYGWYYDLTDTTADRKMLTSSAANTTYNYPYPYMTKPTAGNACPSDDPGSSRSEWDAATTAFPTYRSGACTTEMICDGIPLVSIYNQYAESYIYTGMPSDPSISAGSSGYNFRSDGDLLIAHIYTDQNEFGEITTPTDRLAVFEVSTPVPSLLQIITPSVEKIEIDDNDVGFREGAITFNESLSSSYTLDYSLLNRYDIIANKIVLSFPDGYAIFLDSGKKPTPLFETTEYTKTLRPYLSFSESFTQNAPYNLNNIYDYRYGAGYLYSDVIYDINDSQKGMCYFYNISSNTRVGAITRLTSLEFTVDTEDGNSVIRPLIGLHSDDPRGTIVQKGKISGQTLEYNNDVPLYENGLQDTFGMRVVPTYVPVGLGDDVDDPFIGTATVAGVDVYALITSGTKIKDSAYNRTIRNNDGNGDTGGTYIYEFDDNAKDSFNPPVNVGVQSTLVVSLTSQSNTGEAFIPEPSAGSSSGRVRALCNPTCTAPNGVVYPQGWCWEVHWDHPWTFDEVPSYRLELWDATDDTFARLGDCSSSARPAHKGYGERIVYGHAGIKDCHQYYVKMRFYSKPDCEGDLIAYEESNTFSCCGGDGPPGDPEGIGYRQPRSSIQDSSQYHLAPYGKSGPGNPNPRIYEHDYSNNAKLSAAATYKEYDLGRIRRFSCSYFTENSEVGGGDIIRLGETRNFSSPSLYDEPSTILAGTTSKSIQVISHHTSPDSIPRFTKSEDLSASKYADAAIYNYRQSHFDTHYPEFLSLSIQSNPTDSDRFDLSTVGHLTATSGVPMYTRGIAWESSGMPLYLGPIEARSYMGLALPSPLGFECASFRLHMPAPVGDPASSSAPISFAGGSGISDGFSLTINPFTHDDSMNLAIGQPFPTSGNMNIAVSGVHGIMNTIPCIEGNLFVSAAYSSSENISLHINRDVSTSGIPFYMGSPDPVSGIVGLGMNTMPWNTGIPLFERGYGTSTSNTSLYIGRQFEASELPMAISGPHEVHTNSPPLYVSGSIVPVTASNSIDNNYNHQCLPDQIRSRFDYSTNSELIVSTTETNSISNRHLDGGSRSLGYYVPDNVGDTLKEYSPTYASSYYNDELSRNCVGSNDNYIAIAGNTSSLSLAETSLYIYDMLGEDSVKLKFEYDKIRSDLVVLDILDGSDYYAEIFYKSVSVSDLNKIAVSVRIKTISGLYDAVCILQPATISTTTSYLEILDPCATDTGKELIINTEEIDGWSMTNAFISSPLPSDETSIDRLNDTIGSSVAWHNEDLYFDKQDVSYASVFSVYSSEDYAYERKSMEFSTLADGVGYYSNRNHLPERTKVGFGSVIRIYGDFAFIGAPMLDPYIVDESLSIITVSSPSGAVYIYKYDGGWTHIDTVYSGGYTSQDVSGSAGCGYDAKLFGYDFDFDEDSGYLSVGEPIANKVYRFKISDSGTASFIASYTNSEAAFGDIVNNCSRSILVPIRSKIIDPVYDTDFQYSDSDIESEVSQYVGGAIIEGVDHSIYFAKPIKMSGKSKLLVGRTFDVTYGHSSTIQIEKISLLDLYGIHGNLFIKGPTGANSSLQGLNLAMRSYENKTADLGLQFASFGLTSGIPLHLEVPSSSTLTMPLHMRASTELKIPLFMHSEYTALSSTVPIAISGPIGITADGDLSIPSGHGVSETSYGPSSPHTMFMFGGGPDAGAAIFGADLFIKQVDLIPATGMQVLRTEGIGAGIGGLTGAGTVYISGGTLAHASGITTLAMRAPPFLPVSGITTLTIKTDPSAGDLSKTLELQVSGGGASTGVGWSIEAGATSLYIYSAYPASSGMDLVLYRRGVGGGHEVEAKAPLSIANFTSTSNIDVYISGGYKLSNSMGLALPSGLGVPTSSGTLFTRGYIE